MLPTAVQSIPRGLARSGGRSAGCRTAPRPGPAQRVVRQKAERVRRTGGRQNLTHAPSPAQAIRLRRGRIRRLPGAGLFASGEARLSRRVSAPAKFPVTALDSGHGQDRPGRQGDRRTPETVYGALLDREALEAWLPPGGMRGRIERWDPRPGGGFRMTLTYLDPAAGRGKTSAAEDVVDVGFAALVPFERVVQQAVFEADDPSFAGTSYVEDD
ncbi:SRPBCC domain-containing protein [Streptomyces sp. NPDC006784]|uniref:SRPBCC domain-containing protein n=1 Tax=Streptomyces sp. NPDC006784 TaxID=3364764 RepID=UPI0036B26027